MSIFQKPAAPDHWTKPWLLVRRARFWARLWALAALVWGCHWAGFPGAAGALLGGLLVEVNLNLLILTLKKPAQTTLGPTLGRFYLAFGLTIAFCVLAVKFRWGHPLTFLAGLSSFFLGLVCTLVWLALKSGPASPQEPPSN